MNNGIPDLIKIEKIQHHVKSNYLKFHQLIAINDNTHLC